MEGDGAGAAVPPAAAAPAVEAAAGVKSSELVDACAVELPPILARASGDLIGALDALLLLEKRCRAAADALAAAQVAVAIAKVCWGARDLKQLNAQVLAFCKRRGQLKQAVTELVQAVMAFVPEVSDRAEKEELISTLRTVTDGKIYVEVERARVTRMLADLREAEGRLGEASEVLQEVAVETFGSMEKREKAEILLEQIRLTLAHRDFSRMGILANKVNKKILDDVGFEDLRLVYYDLMAQLAHHRHDALALAQGSFAVISTRGFAADVAKWRPALEAAVLHLACAPWDNAVSDFMHRLKNDKKMEEVAPAYRALAGYLTTPELVPWPLPSPHHEVIAAHPTFALDLCAMGGPARSKYTVAATAAAAAAATAVGASPMVVEGGAGAATAAAAAAGAGSAAPAAALRSSIVLAEDEPRCPSWWPLLQKRVVQHNLRVLAATHSRAMLPRLCALTGLDAPTFEAQLAELVSSKAVHALIDRPAGIITFARKKPATETLSAWTTDLDACLTHIERLVHIVQREQQKAALAKA